MWSIKNGIILSPIRWQINSPGPDCYGSLIPPSLISECSLMLYIEQQPQPQPRNATLWPLTWIPLTWLASRQKMQQHHWLQQVDAQPGTKNRDTTQYVKLSFLIPITLCLVSLIKHTIYNYKVILNINF